MLYEIIKNHEIKEKNKRKWLNLFSWKKINANFLFGKFAKSSRVSSSSAFPDYDLEDVNVIKEDHSHLFSIDELLVLSELNNELEVKGKSSKIISIIKLSLVSILCFILGSILYVLVNPGNNGYGDINISYIVSYFAGLVKNIL